MKNLSETESFRLIYNLLRKIPLSTKITLLLLFCILLQTKAEISYSQTVRVSLNMKNATVEQVLNTIEEKSEFYFLYNSKLINVDRIISVKAKEKPVETILDEIFASTDVMYKIENRQIILKNKNMAKTEINQQTRKISGVVMDEKGEPIIGANVVVVGTTNGIITDVDGQFSLEVPENAKLKVSYIGYNTQEVSIGNRREISIVMTEDTQTLEEVVVVGYGVQKKTTLTGAISSLKTNEIQSVPATNMSQLVTGRVAGVTTVQGSGEPGKDQASIRIRGGDNALVVVDGIIGRDFNSLNPNDIENVTILKDATATAVYGARAQNGVILVTTKRGTSDKIQLNYNGIFALQQEGRKLDYLDVKEMSMRDKRLNAAWGMPETWRQDYYDKIGTDPDGISDQVIHGTNWGNINTYKQLVRNFTPQTQHSLSMTGGNKTTSYFASLGYMNQRAVFKVGDYGFDRYSVRMNSDSKFLNDDLKVSIDMFGQYEDGTYPSSGSDAVYQRLLDSGIKSRPLKFSDGRYTSQSGNDNAWAMLDRNHGYTKEDTKRFNTSLKLEYKIPGLEGLTVKAIGAYDYYNLLKKEWNVDLPLYDYFEDENYNVFNKPTLNETSYSYFDTNFETHLQYINTFGDHDISGLVVYSQNFHRLHQFNAYKKNYVTSAIDELFMGETDGQSNSGSSFESARQGFVGRLTYGYMQKYLFEANFRYDASMNFPKGNRWGFFPSVALGWRVSEESFFKKLISPDIVNNFKIRISYGITGNDGIRDANGNNIYFPYLSTYSITSNRYIFGEGLSAVKGTYESRLPSYDITWEKTKQFNAGVDISLFDSKINASFDGFYYRTTGILLSRDSQSATLLGQKYPQENIGIKRRGGVDLSLNYNGSISDFHYGIGGTFTYWCSLWEYKDENSGTSLIPNWRQTYRKPYYSSTMWVAEDGFFQTFDDIMDHARPITYSTIEKGFIKYQDLNGDGKIDEYDKKYQGYSRDPQINYGITLDGDYKGFSLRLLLSGSGMVSRLLEWNMRTGYLGRPNLRDQQDVWTPDNPNAKYPRILSTDYRSGNNNENSSFWLINASFLRLKNIEIGYDLTRVIKYKGIQGMRVYFSGNNLFTITKVPKYLDPESSNETGASYPLMRVYSVGLNLTF